MADLTAFIQKPGLSGVAPTYTAVNASDTFTALPGTNYELHYQNGATPTGAAVFKMVDTTTPTPDGATPAAGFADAVLSATGMTATTEKKHIFRSDRFRSSAGVVTLQHTGTLTTVKVAITQLP